MPRGPLFGPSLLQKPSSRNTFDIIFRRRRWIIVPALVGVLCRRLVLQVSKYRAETWAQIRPQTISRALLNPIDISSPNWPSASTREISLGALMSRNSTAA